MDSYYYAKTKEYRVMPDNSFYVSSDEYSEDITDELYSACDVHPVIETVSANSYVIYEDYSASDSTTIVYALVHALSSMGSVTMVKDGQYGNSMIYTELVNGRLLSGADISDNQNVCVIDEYTAELLYPGQDAVDKYIFFNKYNGNEQAQGVVVENEEVAFKIVGVIKNSYYTDKEIERSEVYTDQYNKYTYVNIFCPFNYWQNIGEESPIYSSVNYLWNADTAADKENLKNQVQPVASAIGKYNNVTQTIDKQYEYDLAEDELRPLKMGIYYASAALAMITGLTCMSLMFFAMKERINEIGVKKAFGASWIDILAQFLLENSIIALLSGAFAVAASVYLAGLCSDYICANFLSDYEIHVTATNIILPILLSFLEGCVFTLIPSIRYSVISVTKALKLDQ